jgi:cellulose synthase/poly-beta-1,6-N-acetylglucosamine synthase-like glycosyltransferase
MEENMMSAYAIVLTVTALLVALGLLAIVPGAALVFDGAILLLFFLQVYTLVGYPFVLRMIHAPLRRPHRIDDGYEPSVTLLIAAYNEASILTDKLTNSLHLDYPRHKLRILVVSDGSTDETDLIAEQFAGQGVDLLSLSPNRGKMTALNEGFKTISSEIALLSDANVMYDPASIRKLVRHFIDPAIGAVSGKVTLVNDHLSYAAAEVQYYGVEHSIQELEGDTGSMIGSDGAMYALRRELYRPLPADTILDDFLISMSVVSQGYRLIYEPEALAYERNVEEIGREFQRKARIIAGGVQTLLRRHILPPRNDLLTWFKLISHKILRWIMGPMALFMTILMLFRLWMLSPLSWPVAVLLGMVAVCCLLGCFAHFIPTLRRLKLVVLPHYLLAMLGASLVGCWRGLVGSQSVTWKQR